MQRDHYALIRDQDVVLSWSEGIVRCGYVKSKGREADNSTEMVNIRGIASTKERSGKQRVKLEGRDFTCILRKTEDHVRDL